LAFIDAPSEAEFNSVNYWAQQSGSAIGMLGTFCVAGRLVRGVTRMGLTEAKLTETLSRRGLAGLTFKEAAITGFVHDAFFRPTDSKDPRSLLESRIGNGVTGALTMATLTAAALGMKSAGMGLEKSRPALSALLKNDVFAGTVSGMTSGVVAANSNSLLRDGHFASVKETLRASYTMGLVGTGFGAFHAYSEPQVRNTVGEQGTPRVDARQTRSIEGTAPRVVEGAAKPAVEAIAKPALEAPAKPVELTAQQRVELCDMPEPRTVGKSRSPIDSAKLTEAKAATEKIPEIKSGAVDRAGNESQFIDEMITMRERPVEVQKIKGTDVEIIVPKEYAQRLSEVRGLRKIAEQNTEGLAPEQLAKVEAAKEQLAEHPLANRALPEDIAAALEQSPDPTVFKKVFLLDEKNPMDQYWQRTHSGGFESRAQATRDGTLSLYSAERPGQIERYAPINEQIRHEWSHLLKWSNPADGNLFASAMRLEAGVKAREPYAPANVDEAFASHVGEKLLHPDGVQFLAAARMNPISSTLAFDMLAARIEPSRTPAWLKARQAEINQQIRPLAIEQLRTSMGSGQTPEAASLLLRLGGENALAGLPPGTRAIDLTGLKLGDGALSAAATNIGITSVRLNYAQFAEPSLGRLGNLQLRNLELAGTGITDASIPTLLAMKSLKTLDINGTQISFSGYVQLRGSLPQAQIRR